MAANLLRDRMRASQAGDRPDICGPDGKTQAALRYEDGRPAALEAVVTRLASTPPMWGWRRSAPCRRPICARTSKVAATFCTAG